MSDVREVNGVVVHALALEGISQKLEDVVINDQYEEPGASKLRDADGNPIKAHLYSGDSKVEATYHGQPEA